MFRTTLALAFVVGAAGLAADQPPLDIEFDGKVGANPTSPAALQVKATGTYTVPKGETFRKITVTVARRGMPAKGKRVVVATINKANPNAWSAVVEGLDDPGEYEVEAQLHMRDAQGQDKEYETRDIRRVFVTK